MRRFNSTLLLLSLLSAPSVVNHSRAEDPLPDIARLETSPVLRHLKKNPIAFAPSTPAEQTVSQFYVPEGFRVDLVLSEPDLHQPIAFTFDERGRIWVAEAYSYPTKRGPGEGEDKIVIFEDKDGNGKFETRKVFAEKLNLVSGFEVGYGGIWIGAAPELLFIPDKNRDDVPDSAPQVLLDGFGYQDTHECLNSFLWGPDGWLYGIQGVFNLAHIGKPGASDKERTELRAGVWRYHPLRHEFEVFAHGGSNPWGLDYDEHGQLFMTHCRSYWGRGGATHVIQGAQFWNQANANYAPYIIADPPREFPELQNYLLASARHDHGAGGAGARGTDAIYGGHSHVGTMIYYGDNWPAEYRGQMFTHNLGGHQINRDINKRLGSGYETVHAENDMLFCTDPKYVAVDLQYGLDGAVYFIDWYDQQHCHNPNTERWDRTNGRMYRMAWKETYKPRKTDLTKATLNDLVRLQVSPNAWHARTALRLINERFNADKIDPSKAVPDEDAFNELMLAQTQLAELAEKSSELRMRYLWVARAANLLGDGARLDNTDEFVRAWAVQFAVEQRNASDATLKRLIEMAASDKSPVVRRYLASAMQRVPEAAAWQIAEALSQRAEDEDDRNIPKLLYQSIAQRMTGNDNIIKGLQIAAKTPLSLLRDWITWYAVSQEGPGHMEAIARIAGAKNDPDLLRLMTITDLALAGRDNVIPTDVWLKASGKLFNHSDIRISRLADRIDAAFGRRQRFEVHRKTLADKSAPIESRRHAYALLTRYQDDESLPAILQLLNEKDFGPRIIPPLSRFDSPEIPKALIAEFPNLAQPDRAAALNVLTARPAYALALLDAVAGNKIGRDQLSAFHVRQLTQLNNPEVEKRVTAVWGRFTKTSDEKKSQIDRMEKTFNEAPLWAYSANAGREHFKTLCAQCHKLGEDGLQFGPELTGSARHGIRYFLENIIDPNAVVGSDFQMTNIETKDGELISGLLANETDDAVTIRTQTEKRTLPKTQIAKRELSEKSLMPESLIESLPPREQLELLKYLTAK
jgi:putative membrane-bound dehydrogenase-like protein